MHASQGPVSQKQSRYNTVKCYKRKFCNFTVNRDHINKRPFQTTVKCASKPFQMISHLNWIDRNAHFNPVHLER